MNKYVEEFAKTIGDDVTLSEIPRYWKQFIRTKQFENGRTKYTFEVIRDLEKLSKWSDFFKMHESLTSAEYERRNFEGSENCVNCVIMYMNHPSEDTPLFESPVGIAFNVTHYDYCSHTTLNDTFSINTSGNKNSQDIIQTSVPELCSPMPNGTQVTIVRCDDFSISGVTSDKHTRFADIAPGTSFILGGNILMKADTLDDGPIVFELTSDDTRKVVFGKRVDPIILDDNTDCQIVLDVKITAHIGHIMWCSPAIRKEINSIASKQQALALEAYPGLLNPLHNRIPTSKDREKIREKIREYENRLKKLRGLYEII